MKTMSCGSACLMYFSFVKYRTPPPADIIAIEFHFHGDMDTALVKDLPFAIEIPHEAL